MLHRSAYLTLLLSASVAATTPPPFEASCEEGQTYRYDGGNGLDMTGREAPFEYGWTAEKWGDLDVKWAGGKAIELGQIQAIVLTAQDSVVSAVGGSSASGATNVYSFVIDLQTGYAVFSQVQASSLGKNRAVKVRSQNLTCTVP